MIDNIPVMLSLQSVDPETYETAGLIPIELDVAFTLVERGATVTMYDENGEPFWVIEPLAESNSQKVTMAEQVQKAINVLFGEGLDYGPNVTDSDILKEFNTAVLFTDYKRG